MPPRYWVETLGCPKNQVDSDKLSGTFGADGFDPAARPEDADVVVVNTCAFIEEARQESVETILELSQRARPSAEVVVTGCLAERYGDELAAAMPEVSVRGFGQAVSPGAVATNGGDGGAATAGAAVQLGPRRARRVPDFDLLNLPRPASARPWAYVKVAEGCDRACGFCAIPSFRGRQRSRSRREILEEVAQLGVREVVLVAQDLASYGRDQGVGTKEIVPLVRAVAEQVDRVRLLYLYPSELTDALIDAVCQTGVPYFDLSLQHVSRPLLRRMRRYGDGPRFQERIAAIRRREPDAVLRSNFIVGYPGETEQDHDLLLEFLQQARLDWCGFFAYSPEEGTYAADLPGEVPRRLVEERLAELRELQDRITAERRDETVGRRIEVLVDRVGEARSYREAPEIDGIVTVPEHLEVGTITAVDVVDALGPDLVATDAADSAGNGAR